MVTIQNDTRSPIATLFAAFFLLIAATALAANTATAQSASKAKYSPELQECMKPYGLPINDDNIRMIYEVMKKSVSPESGKKIEVLKVKNYRLPPTRAYLKTQFRCVATLVDKDHIITTGSCAEDVEREIGLDKLEVSFGPEGKKRRYKCNKLVKKQLDLYADVAIIKCEGEPGKKHGVEKLEVDSDKEKNPERIEMPDKAAAGMPVKNKSHRITHINESYDLERVSLTPASRVASMLADLNIGDYSQKIAEVKKWKVRELESKDLKLGNDGAAARSSRQAGNQPLPVQRPPRLRQKAGSGTPAIKGGVQGRKVSLEDIERDNGKEPKQDIAKLPKKKAERAPSPTPANLERLRRENPGAEERARAVRTTDVGSNAGYVPRYNPNSIISPQLARSMNRGFYNHAITRQTRLPRGPIVTMCHNGGCLGQTKIDVSKDQRLIDGMAQIMREKNPDGSAQGELRAIGHAIEYFYQRNRGKLRPEDVTAEIRNASDEELAQQGRLHRTSSIDRWECVTHAQNASAAIYTLQKYGLLKHHSLHTYGVSHNGWQPHFWSRVRRKSDGRVISFDSYYGRSRWANSGFKRSCRRDLDSPVCIVGGR